jgi:hypothetical protein
MYTLGDYEKQQRSVSVVFSRDDEKETGLGWYWEADTSHMDRTIPLSFATKEEAIKDAERFNRIVSNK